MDPSNNQTTNGTTTNTSSSSRPPSWVWVLVALASAITIGVLSFGLYQFIKRRRARRRDGDPEGAAAATDTASRGGGSTRGSRPWGRRRRSRRHEHSQPASRWGWVYPHNRGSTQSSEGLNELGEAPPPYNEDDLEPCLTDMVEVSGLGERPSRAASRQDRGPMGGGGGVGPAMPAHHPGEPAPAYDFSMNLSASTVQLPPPVVVVSEARDT
ncbi:hypothetical protein Daus18300_002207 [Diaporthe australafricana]|uniref:Uncharacterized protein n=1 Tax=Diaporthe australafricana TaxID=127596 RepID=A0ABR3XQL6_9PEZI